jgi:hypothetical protein
MNRKNQTEAQQSTSEFCVSNAKICAPSSQSQTIASVEPFFTFFALTSSFSISSMLSEKSLLMFVGRLGSRLTTYSFGRL